MDSRKEDLNIGCLSVTVIVANSSLGEWWIYFFFTRFAPVLLRGSRLGKWFCCLLDDSDRFLGTYCECERRHICNCWG